MLRRSKLFRSAQPAIESYKSTAKMSSTFFGWFVLLVFHHPGNVLFSRKIQSKKNFFLEYFWGRVWIKPVGEWDRKDPGLRENTTAIQERSWTTDNKCRHTLARWSWKFSDRGHTSQLHWELYWSRICPKHFLFPIPRDGHQCSSEHLLETSQIILLSMSWSNMNEIQRFSRPFSDSWYTPYCWAFALFCQ